MSAARGGWASGGMLVWDMEASQKRRLRVRVAICSPTPGDYRQNRKCHLFNKHLNACQCFISHWGITVNSASPFCSLILSRCKEKIKGDLISAFSSFWTIRIFHSSENICVLLNLFICNASSSDFRYMSVGISCGVHLFIK